MNENRVVRATIVVRDGVAAVNTEGYWLNSDINRAIHELRRAARWARKTLDSPYHHEDAEGAAIRSRPPSARLLNLRPEQVGKHCSECGRPLIDQAWVNVKYEHKGLLYCSLLCVEAQHVVLESGEYEDPTDEPTDMEAPQAEPDGDKEPEGEDAPDTTEANEETN